MRRQRRHRNIFLLSRRRRPGGGSNRVGLGMDVCALVAPRGVAFALLSLHVGPTLSAMLTAAVSRPFATEVALLFAC